MKIYCAHTGAQYYRPSNFIQCRICDHAWYTNDPAPLVVIGVTSEAEVERYPFPGEE